jgi:diaminopimelate decarboxylase
LFAHDLARFGENAHALQGAMAQTGLPFRLRLALKANPLPEVLAVFRGLGEPGTPESVSIDACSPGEVLRALECGWRPDEISYTGTNVSERDLDVLVAHGIHCNLDAISQIERYGRRASGTRIGIRIDPATGAGYKPHLEYSGKRPTKFGIGLERLDEALAAAYRHDLSVDTIHFHAGSGWLAEGLGAFERALPAALEAVERARAAGHDIREVNVGGGLGVPARANETGVDLEAYAAVVARYLGPLGVTVSAEPGDALTKDAAILLGEVVTVERRRGVTFVGLDMGWNVNCAYFIYGFAQEIVPCHDAAADRTERVTVAGHINEASDVFAEDYPMAPVEEGDMVALLNAGGYHQAMSSTHCLRPMGAAVFLER